MILTVTKELKCFSYYEKSLIFFILSAKICNAIGNLDHCLNQDSDIMTISMKGASDGEPNEEDSHPNLKQQLFLRHSVAKVHKRKCVADITSAKTNSQSGSTNSLKTQRLSLNPVIRHLRTLRHALLTLNNSLGG